MRTCLVAALAALSVAATSTPEPSPSPVSSADAGTGAEAVGDAGVLTLRPFDFRTPAPFGRYPPECGTILGYSEGMARGFARLSHAFIGEAVPNVGVRAEGQRQTLAASIGLPLTWTFGPATHTSVERWRCGEIHDDFQPNRLTGEPSVLIGPHPAFLLRPAYRFV